jgi:ketosteroid isomerase-like protein
LRVSGPKCKRYQPRLAWVVGTENAKGKTKAGATVAFDIFVTNIYEKDGNHWLMVSHHAGILSK